MSKCEIKQSVICNNFGCFYLIVVVLVYKAIYYHLVTTLVKRMEISIAIESGVLNHEGGAVPPPVIEVVPGVLAFEYKWLVACHPYVTKVRLPNDLSVSKRQEIEQIIG